MYMDISQCILLSRVLLSCVFGVSSFPACLRTSPVLGAVLSVERCYGQLDWSRVDG